MIVNVWFLPVLIYLFSFHEIVETIESSMLAGSIYLCGPHSSSLWLTSIHISSACSNKKIMGCSFLQECRTVMVMQTQTDLIEQLDLILLSFSTIITRTPRTHINTNTRIFLEIERRQSLISQNWYSAAFGRKHGFEDRPVSCRDEQKTQSLVSLTNAPLLDSF